MSDGDSCGGKGSFGDTGLQRLIEILIERGYQVIGPTLRDQAITLGALSGIADLPRGWGVTTGPGLYRVRPRSDGARFGHSAGPQAWKQFLHPPHRKLWSSDADLCIDGDATTPPRYAFLGVRGCDLAAIGTLDRVLVGGRQPDESYAARRGPVFVVAVECTEPGGVCFCASMGTGPAAGHGYDLKLTELVDGDQCRYVVEVGSPAGADILAVLPHDGAAPDDITRATSELRDAAERMGRRMPDTDLRALLIEARESAHWDDVASRCLACGNCTMVCPTCFCTSTEDVSDLTGEHAERWQHWASCFELDFSMLHQGSVRQSGAARYRHWITHKLSSWHDQFGMSGCVGCGRCIAWCPTGIDITAEMATLAGDPGDEHA